MSTSSRSYHGHAYNAEDARIADDLRQREADRRIRRAGVEKRRGCYGKHEQVLALIEWVKLLYAEGKIESARRVRATAKRIDATIQ